MTDTIKQKIEARYPIRKDIDGSMMQQATNVSGREAAKWGYSLASEELKEKDEEIARMRSRVESGKRLDDKAREEIAELKGIINGQKIKLLERRSAKIELLERYSEWLFKANYIDTDFYTEPPTAIDEFMRLESSKVVTQEK